MSTDFILTSDSSFAAEMQRLLVTASQAPWGPGREIDETVHHLHLELLGVKSRLGSVEEKPQDLELANKIDHELRNKLMIYHYHEQKRHLPAPPARRRRSRTAKVSRFN